MVKGQQIRYKDEKHSESPSIPTSSKRSTSSLGSCLRCQVWLAGEPWGCQLGACTHQKCLPRALPR